MESLQVHLALHGALVLAISMISGRWFSKAIKTEKSEVAWRVVHSGGSMGGISLIAIAGIFDLIPLPMLLLTAFVWLFIVGMWAITIGMIAAAVTGQRGLDWHSSKTGKRIYIMYMIGTVTLLLGIGLLIVGLFLAL